MSTSQQKITENEDDHVSKTTSKKTSTAKDMGEFLENKSYGTIDGSKITLENDAKEFMYSYDPTKNISDPVLSKYEYATIIGTRATMISKGAPPLIDVPDGVESAEEIAVMELEAKKCPFIVVRDLGNHRQEFYKLADLQILF